MRLRTFLIIALALSILFAIVFFANLNRDVLIERLEIVAGTTIPVGWALLWAFVTGVAITAFVGLAREAGLMLERWRARSAGRKADEIEDEYSRGLVALLEGREDEALRSFRAVIERDSRHFNTLLKLGEVLRTQGKHDEAIELHRKAQNLKPESTRPLYALAEDHEAAGDMDQARAVMGKILGKDKSSQTAWRRLRALHVKIRNWDDAIDAQTRLERLAGGRPSETDRQTGLGIRHELAEARRAQGKPRDAIAGFRKLLKYCESFIPAHVGLGQALCDSGRDAEAIEAWHKGFESTGSPIFLTLLENHHLEREQPLAAIEALKQCVARARRDTLPRFHLGKLYFRLEMLDDALSVLASLEGRASYAPSLHYLLGRIHDRRKNWRNSADEYRKVIKEMDLVQLDYACRACAAASTDWSARCESCGRWNTIEVNFREEISLDELGLSPAPIYSTEDS